MTSRLTFRNKITSEAWQYKVRKQSEEKWLNSNKYRFWQDIDLSLKKAVIKEVERKTAEKIILEYEWLGDMAITNKYYGIFFGNYCGGVICINTNGNAAHCGKFYGIESSQVSYFARGACAFWTPTGSASKLLAFALKMEKERGALVAVAYADNDAGEYGTVYQASNWIFTGYTQPEPQYVKNNKIIDSRQWKGNYAKDKTYKNRLLSDGWKLQYGNKKGRYVYILASGKQYDKIYNKIKKLIAPYPKRKHAGIVQDKEQVADQQQDGGYSDLPAQ